MTFSDIQAAKQALAEGRERYTNLDQLRKPSETSTDIVYLWDSVERSLQAMLGGSSLSGDLLIKEVRQKSVINLEQANLLISFWDIRQKSAGVGYRPTITDVSAVRSAYEKMRAVLDQHHVAQPDATRVGGDQRFAPGADRTAGGNEFPHNQAGSANSNSTSFAGSSSNSTSFGSSNSGTLNSGNITSPPPPKSGVGKAIGVGCGIVVVAIAILAGLGYWGMSSGSAYEKDRDRAIALMQDGEDAASLALFKELEEDNPGKAEPKVFVARLLRSVGQPDDARRKLVEAIEIEPDNSVALREMGLLYYSQADYEKARNFFTHAIKADAEDKMALGFMGCSLVKLNQVSLADKFFSRAGSGQWDDCRQ